MRIVGLITGAFLASTSIATAQNCPSTFASCPPVSTKQINLGGPIVNQQGVPFVPPVAMPSASGQVLTTNGDGTTRWSNAGGGIAAPGTTTPNFVPLWNSQTGAALANGLPTGVAGASVLLQTGPGGKIDPSTVPIATTNALGGIVPDGTTIITDPTTGLTSAQGGVASAVSTGTTAITGGTPGALVVNTAGKIGNIVALPAANEPAHTGDVTNTAGSLAMTLATVNSSPGSVGSASLIPVLTTNGKGLVTTQSFLAVIAPAGTLTGTALPSNVVGSSLTSLGTLGTLNVSGTASAATVSVGSALNGWAPAFGLVPGGTALVFGGTNNAVGDVLTLNDGCSTHSKVAVVAAPAGVIGSSGYNVVQQGSCLTAPAGAVGVLSSTGSDTSATFTTAWKPTQTGGNVILGTLTNNNGNTFLNSESNALFAGTESVWIGDRTGANVGSGSFNLAAGHDAVGIGGTGCPVIYVSGTTALGTDALRNTCGNNQITAVGSTVLRNYNQTGTAANFYGFGLTAVGTQSMLNWNGAVAFPYVTALGDNSCQGQTGSSFILGTCIGAVTGQALTTATNFLEISGGKANNGQLGVGNSVFASGNGVILIGSGRKTVDTPLANTIDYINFENVWTVTNTSNPAASQSTFPGSVNVVGTLSVNGAPVGVGGYTGVYGIALSSPIAPTSGGTGYTVGDTLTVTDGCSPSATMTVRTAPSGIGATLVPLTPGSCTAPIAGALATTGGTGTGLTVTPVYAPIAASIFVPTITGNAENFWLGNNGPAAGYIGINSVLIGPEIGKTLTGASTGVTAVGFQSCGGTSAATLTMTSISCFGDQAGKFLAGTASISNIDIFGTLTLSSQAQATRNISAFGGSSLANLNTSAAPANLAAFGPLSCQGASGATFSSGVCVGALTGSVLSSATSFLIMGPLVGRTTFASGTDVVLIGTSATVDTPAAGTTHWMNLNNVILATSVKPTATSGFGTSPAVAGNGSAVFSVTVGATGTPTSTQVVTFATAAPTGWGCHVTDETSVSSLVFSSVATSATVATWSSFSRTTGVATAPNVNDVLRAECIGQ